MVQPVPAVLGIADTSADTLDERDHFAAPPTAAYGIVLAMVTIAYVIFEKAIIAYNGPGSKLAAAVGNEWKGVLSLAIYVMGLLLAFVSPWIAVALYIAVALLWFVPDRRIEAAL